MSCNNNISNEVRVRFAPSPTGYVHLGSLRTALYNYLFAKKNKGKLVLRIEDTDQKRFVKGAIENLLNVMSWAGLEFDEGPLQGGDFGPYIQSKRTDVYQRECSRLIQSGKAYPCFCSAERLENMRSHLMAAGKDARYDGFCKSIDPEIAAEKIKAGEKHVIRLSVPKDKEIQWIDLIRGAISFDSNLIDDQILIKSDGFPTYHLANVIDDHYMNITHIIRGEEWVSSTPKHILLYNAFKWHIPDFAHLPLLLNPDKSKLSKRQGDVAVEDYIKKGFLPESLINFIGLLGWNPGNDEEFYTIEEMKKSFDLNRISKSGSVFDIKKLEFINAHYMKKLSSYEKAEMCERALEDSGLIPKAYLSDKKEWLIKVIDYCGERISQPDKIIEYAGFLFKKEIEFDLKSAKKHLYKENAITSLEIMIDFLEKTDSFNRESLEEQTKIISEKSGIKLGKLIQPLRIACTGSAVSFGIFEILETLGKEETIRRAVLALEAAKKNIQ